MIISKMDGALTRQYGALVALQAALETVRGSSEAREEAAALRNIADQTGVCQYCRETIIVKSARHSEACDTCGRLLDGALMSKSKILNSTYNPDMLIKLRNFYTTKYAIPYALRGSGVDEVVSRIDALLDATEAVRRCKHEARVDMIRRNIEAKRKDALRREYRLFKPSLTSEALDEIVEAQYGLRYPQDV